MEAAEKKTERVSKTLDATRSCTIQITNNSTVYCLNNPKDTLIYMYHGYCYYPPEPKISSNAYGVCAFQKTVNTACGAVGVLTYDLCSIKNEVSYDRMAILFSVPYNYMFYDNIFGLGVFTTDSDCDQALYKTMYYGSDGSCTHGKAKDGGITYGAQSVELGATMSNVSDSIIKVEIHDM